jgi:hypothetical protein
MSDAPVARAAPPEPAAAPSLTTEALLRTACVLYRRHFWAFFSVTLVAAGALVLVFCALMSADKFKIPGPLGNALKAPLSLGASVLMFALAVAAYGVTKGTLTLIAAAALGGRRPSAAEAFVALFAVLPRLLAASLILVALGYAGSCCVCLPNLVVSVFLCLVIPVIAIEGKGPFSAIGRGWRLVCLKRPLVRPRSEQSNFRRAFSLGALAFLLCLLAAVPGALLTSAAGVAPRAYQEGAFVTMLAVIGIVAALLYPPFAIADTLLYFDIRLRYEGFDVEAAAAASACARLDSDEAPTQSPEGGRRDE